MTEDTKDPNLLELARGLEVVTPRVGLGWYDVAAHRGIQPFRLREIEYGPRQRTAEPLGEMKEFLSDSDVRGSGRPQRAPEAQHIPIGTPY